MVDVVHVSRKDPMGTTVSSLFLISTVYCTGLSRFRLMFEFNYFTTYIKQKGVHINYAQLGMVETVTLGWIGQSHPSFGCRDETKE
jgi:hypothetical protein